MSLLIIPRETYFRFWKEEYDRGIAKGKPPSEAKDRACTLMSNVFAIDDMVQQIEFERDIADDRLGITS